MSTSLTRSAAARNAAANAVVDLLDVNAPGKLIIMTAADVVLSEHALSNPAFGAAAAGVATAGAIGDDTAANATGTAALYKVEDGNALEVWRGSVGLTGEALNLNSLSIVAGTTVSVSALTYTAPNP
ncbi:MAG TPA: hypothetical protein VMV77_16810 [Bacteroidales bacterium]|nr:hypothetical protein [Bacteroidales bacterium]